MRALARAELSLLTPSTTRTIRLQNGTALYVTFPQHCIRPHEGLQGSVLDHDPDGKGHSIFARIALVHISIEWRHAEPAGPLAR